MTDTQQDQDDRSRDDMALDFEIADAPITPVELVSLVRAIVRAEPSDETDFLARAILAFANRMPDVATTAFRGYGLVVVGAEPGRIIGVPEVPDPIELHRWVTRFTGYDGPRWRATAVPVDGQHVLIVHVEPPRWGDPIHVARRSSERIADGDVFVRVGTANRRAGSAEQSLLQQRLLRSRQMLDVDIRVIAGVPVRPVAFDGASTSAWIEAQAANLLAPLRLPSSKLSLSIGHGLARSVSSAIRLLPMLPENRPPEEYERQVRAYVAQCEHILPGLLPKLATRVVEPLALSLVNNSSHNFAGVEVVVQLAGELNAMQSHEWLVAASNDRLPPRPRMWGPRPNPVFRRRMTSEDATVSRGKGFPRVEKTSCLTVTFPSAHLRPESSAMLGAITLLAPASMSEIHATWTATATTTDGVSRGTLTIDVRGAPVTITTLQGGH
jgi:hypothetical protein